MKACKQGSSTAALWENAQAVMIPAVLLTLDAAVTVTQHVAQSYSDQNSG
jgi:hypothetical protein